MFPGGGAVLRKDSCISCRHCAQGQRASENWCRLRNLVVPVELAKFAFCHHWTQRSPSLPRIAEDERISVIDRQLDFGGSLASTSKEDEYSII